MQQTYQKLTFYKEVLDMAYTTLRTLYYGDENAYKSEYLARFNSPDACVLDFEVAGRPAFFLQNHEVSDFVYQILRLDKEILMLKHQLPGIALKQYSNKCLIDEIVLTNKIEGVHSSRKEIGDALALLEAQSEQKGQRHRFIGLVNKYLKLMSKAEIAISSCQDIRDIYDEMFLQEVVAEDPHNAPDGKIFRKDPAAVHSATDRIIHEGVMPESKIIRTMEQALSFLNDKSIEPLYRISLFHYMMEYIHPFYDGNGRLGRFIFSYCISKELDPLLSYRISETVKEQIKAYYTAFETCNDPHNLADLTPFLIMMLEMLLAASVDLRDSLKRKLVSWNKYENLADSLAKNDAKLNRTYSLLIQAALFSERGISVKEVMEVLEVSYSTVKNLLKRVADAGLLLDKKDGPTKFYQINLQKLDDMMLNV